MLPIANDPVYTADKLTLTAGRAPYANCNDHAVDDTGDTSTDILTGEAIGVDGTYIPAPFDTNGTPVDGRPATNALHHEDNVVVKVIYNVNVPFDGTNSVNCADGKHGGDGVGDGYGYEEV
jgi:hypothetical protein